VTPSPTERRLAADKFVEEWRGKGREDEDDQTFWNQFLQEVMGVARVHHEIDYQKKVKIIGAAGTGRIDAYIPSSKVLIEQKSLAIDLDAKQPGHDDLTPYEQAVRYAQNLPLTERPNYIIVSDFGSFRLYDCREDFNQAPVAVTLEELPDNLQVFHFLISEINEKIEKEERVNRDAARRIGRLYKLMAGQYRDQDSARHDLSVLMVRILFCLYAEDSGLFDEAQFTSYLKTRMEDLSTLRHALIDVFTTLSTPPEARAANYDINEALQQFPYVNGGLFESEIQVPPLTEEIKLELLAHCANFNWAPISPVIFGSIFESILSGDERRAGGMHYTSPANIHKVIDPLFLDGLRSELNGAGHERAKLLALQDKMASLKFLDPACGSGNFLTQTYLDLRRMENDILERLYGDAGMGSSASGQTGMNFDTESLIKVHVEQFYGIEINDFAVSVASTALWIADHQANQETSRILDHPYINLPLKKLHNIVCENALRFDWSELLPAEKCNYVMGNPPFVGSSNCTAKQKQDIVDLYGKIRLSNSLDYVAGWYYKTCEMMVINPEIKAALVSTNSITQGEQVAPLWGTLFERFDVHIDFAWRTFIWNSEAKDKAHVHCVIIGFSIKQTKMPKTIYDSNGDEIDAQNINAYLVNAPNVLVVSQSKPICDIPQMTYGNKPSDGGHLILTLDEKEELLLEEPASEQFIKRYIGSTEFINGNNRYCIWLHDVSFSLVKKCSRILARIEQVRAFRLASSAKPTVEKAETPQLFFSITQPKTNYLAIPEVSSGQRRYIPIGYLSPDVIASNKLCIVPNATLYHFGVLTSSVHMAWTRAVCGRLKSDYQYSKAIVYNNFPWPDVSDEQKAEIEHLAQGILDARAQYPDSNLADMYGERSMPFHPELVKAHKALDKAVERAYGVNFHGNEERIVAHLFKLYSEKAG